MFYATAWYPWKVSLCRFRHQKKVTKTCLFVRLLACDITKINSVVNQLAGTWYLGEWVRNLELLFQKYSYTILKIMISYLRIISADEYLRDFRLTTCIYTVLQFLTAIFMYTGTGWLCNWVLFITLTKWEMQTHQGCDKFGVFIMVLRSV